MFPLMLVIWIPKGKKGPIAFRCDWGKELPRHPLRFLVVLNLFVTHVHLS